jgi:hypothetical protein
MSNAITAIREALAAVERSNTFRQLQDAQTDLVLACDFTAISELLAKLDAYKKDAQRYQALRDFPCTFSPIIHPPFEPHVGYLPSGLDAITDKIVAARRAAVVSTRNSA